MVNSKEQLFAWILGNKINAYQKETDVHSLREQDKNQQKINEN